MSAHPIGSGDRVPQPTHRQFAIHIAERMPSEFTELTRIEALRLPRPVVGPLRFQHAAATLHLPSNYGMPNWEMCIPGIEDGINRLWSTDPMNGISVPEEVRILRAFNQVLRAQVVTTPADVGLRFPPQVLEGLAWRVLGRVRPEAVAVMCASAALRIEVRGIGSEAEMFAHDVAFLDPLATRLANLARHGAVFLSPDCLRWIIREAAVADIDGSWLATGRCALPNDDHGAAAAVVFPCLFGDGAPTPSEIIRAFWAIQQVYRFADEAFSTYADEHDAGPAAMTSLVSLQPQTGAWLPRLERWRQIMSVEDSDLALAWIRFRPTAMRAAFRREVGLSIDEWLGLSWLIAISYAQLAQVDRTTFLRTPTQLVNERFRAPLHPRFEEALRARAVTTFAKFGAAVRNENPGYAGIGTLRTLESLAARNAPFLDLDVGNDSVIPLGLHAIVDRAVSLPRLVIAPSTKGITAREINNTIGKGFEAYVRDTARSARGRHQVLSGQEIDAVVPAGDSRCDVLLVHQHSYLLVEAGLQTLTTKIPRGDVTEIRKKCESYHDKADQADATRKHLAALAVRNRLLAPTQVATLVAPSTGPQISRPCRAAR